MQAQLGYIYYLSDGNILFMNTEITDITWNNANMTLVKAKTNDIIYFLFNTKFVHKVHTYDKEK